MTYTNHMDATLDKLEALGHQFATSRAQTEADRELIRQAVIDAYHEGNTETAIGLAAQIDRSTVRRWLGKL